MTGPLAEQFAQVREALAGRVRGTDICQWCDSEGEQPHDPECVLSVLSVIERHVQEMEKLVSAYRLINVRLRASTGDVLIRWDSIPDEGRREAVRRACSPLIINPEPLSDEALVGLRAALPAREEGEK